MSAPPRSFAIVPAAGESFRMGRPKLLLEWRGKTLLEHAFQAWRNSRVSATLVVVRPDDRELAKLVLSLGGHLVVPPLPPPDMRASVAFAVGEIRRALQPAAHDAWLVAPADMPLLSTAVIDRLIDEHDASPNCALVPVHGNRRGHPVLFPWHWTPRLRHLEPGEGLNALLSEGLVRNVDCQDLGSQDDPFVDIDTPDDFNRLPA
jgi:molybdenum cofactor cytidylyltransferase